MRKVHLKARAGPARTTLVPVIPSPFIETVIYYCHTDLFSLHSDTTKTIDKVRKHAYWQGWKRDAIEYVRACSVCDSGKGYRLWRNGLMQRMPVYDLSPPFSLVVVDAIGPLVTTPRDNKYILAFADHFTRWVEAFPVKKLNTVTFVNSMVDEVVSRRGVPERLLSDRGPNFISNLAQSFYQTLRIKNLFGASYHPQTQGLVERFNGRLGFVSPSCTVRVPYLNHESLGDSSFFSLYGRDPILPLDLAFLNTSSDWKSNEVAAYRRKLFLSMRDSRRMVERQLLKAQSRHARSLEDQVPVAFAEGDAVWVYQYFRARCGECKTKKLAFSWHGPYRVVEPVGENTYRVAIPSHPDPNCYGKCQPYQKISRTDEPTFPQDVPDGVYHQVGVDDDGPLTEEDLPPTSFVEKIVIGDEETAFTGVSNSIVDILTKRKVKRDEQYLVLTASYEVCWRRTPTVLPDYEALIDVFEDKVRTVHNWPELRRSARLVDANAAAGEDELLS
ncbi:hypothetical protein PHMEG_00022969 [Phytophthora megakarya]|uniref:Integrase catalytic domain-containing protein n=1 Tax=Phytophthora megakarya TaxID=4795 RepID=A0A225VHC6_9STRA|nr:hypothetical protein PHMEG_00022969 [Phytophthora megakarya]